MFESKLYPLQFFPLNWQLSAHTYNIIAASQESCEWSHNPKDTRIPCTDIVLSDELNNIGMNE